MGVVILFRCPELKVQLVNIRRDGKIKTKELFNYEDLPEMVGLYFLLK